jgi:hypothetical protein
MITYDDVVSTYPTAERFERDRVDAVIEIANAGFPDSRFGGKPAVADRGRLLYVMHMLEKPPVDLDAPHVRAQMGAPKPFIKKPHPWHSTEYGKDLSGLVS